MRDLTSHISPVTSIAPAVLTATANGASVDLLGFNSAALVISTGAIAGSGNFAPKMQESDDNSTWNDVASSDLTGPALPAALAASTTYELGYKGFKRYVRPVLSLVSGTSIAASAVVIRGNPAKQPAA
ncbi:hypothetical protein HJB78_00920 [Rhizobium lentis]|uniref:hypothetical protein n=1 Tax=Rhizobium lentis TaxID=1138194 RepID=UPI001C8354DB|nr:hypothetical protein [Rhizobium lentis]MBX5149567.1 hypothetical protein [Rhizobium lentis]